MLQRPDEAGGRAGGRAVCPGVDRVLWLRVQLHDGAPAAGVVHGIRHRRPVDVTVSLDTVRRLLARGVPAVGRVH